MGGHRYIPGVNYRTNSESVVSGSQTITFLTELSSDGYEFVVLDLWNTLNEKIPLDKTAVVKSADKFVITIPEAGTLVYLAMMPL